MKVELVDIDKLKPFEANPRVITEDGLVRLKVSIEGFGFVEPIIAWRNEKNEPEIVVGHQRWKGAKRAGKKQVPVIFYPFETREQAIAYNIASNRLAELSDWDFPRLKDNLEFVDTGNLDVEFTGFSVKEIESLMTWVRPDFDKTKDELAEIEAKFTAEHGGGLQHLILVFKCDDREQFDTLRAFFSKDGSRECDVAKLWEAYERAAAKE